MKVPFCTVALSIWLWFPYVQHRDRNNLIRKVMREINSITLAYNDIKYIANWLFYEHIYIFHVFVRISQ